MENRYSLDFIISNWDIVVNEIAKDKKKLSSIIKKNRPNKFMHDRLEFEMESFSSLFFEVGDYNTYNILMMNYDLIKKAIKKTTHIDVALRISENSVVIKVSLLKFFKIQNSVDANKLYEKIANREIRFRSRDLKYILFEYPITGYHHNKDFYSLLYMCREDAKDVEYLFDTAIYNFKKDAYGYRFKNLYHVVRDEYIRIERLTEKENSTEEYVDTFIELSIDKFQDAYFAGCWECSYYTSKLYLMRQDKEEDWWDADAIGFWALTYLEACYSNKEYYVEEEMYDVVVKQFMNGLGIGKDLKKAYYWSLLGMNNTYRCYNEDLTDIVSELEKILPIECQLSIQEKTNEIIANMNRFRNVDNPKIREKKKEEKDEVSIIHQNKFNYDVLEKEFNKDNLTILIKLNSMVDDFHDTEADYLCIEYVDSETPYSGCIPFSAYNDYFHLKDRQLLIKIAYFNTVTEGIEFTKALTSTCIDADAVHVSNLNRLMKDIFGADKLGNKECLVKRTPSHLKLNIRVTNPEYIKINP